MSAPEPTAEHKRTAARLIDAIYDRGTVDAIECKAAEGLIARALAAREARGFERAADYIEEASIPLPISDWMGTKKDLVAAFARALATEVRARAGTP